MPTCERCGGNIQPGDPCWPCRETDLAERYERLAALPTALYRLYDDAGDLLYVGITSDPERRWKEHRKTATWWPQVAHRQIDWCDNRGIAATAEREAITEERPRHNAECSNPVWLAAREQERLDAEERKVRRNRRGEPRRRMLADIARRRQALLNQEWLPD